MRIEFALWVLFLFVAFSTSDCNCNGNNCLKVADVPVCANFTGDVSGTWNEEYTCDDEARGCQPGSVVFTMIQAGLYVNIESTEGGNFSGNLENNQLDWSGGGAGWEEAGTFIFDCAATMFVKTTSTYTEPDGNTGNCTGVGNKS